MDLKALEAQLRPRTYRLGEWLFEPATGDIRPARADSVIWGAMNEAIDGGERYCRLEPRVSQVLEVLMCLPRQVITRDALLEQVWPGLAVVEENLTRCISLIRKAFQDTPPFTYVETLPKRGYRLMVIPAVVDDRPEDQGAQILSWDDRAKLTQDLPRSVWMKAM